MHAGTGVLDLGEYVCSDLVSVRPTVVALTRIGSTDFRALSQQERVDALVVIEQHRAWLDGLQQQVLAEVALGDTSEDKWLKEEVACALGLAPQTAGAKLKNAEQLCTRLPGTLGLLLEGRISELQARAVTEACAGHRCRGWDGVVERAAGRRTRPRLPAEDRRRRPDGTISVIVSLETLAGVEDEPGWLDGYGPITADTARALAADENRDVAAVGDRPDLRAGHRLRHHPLPGPPPTSPSW